MFLLKKIVSAFLLPLPLAFTSFACAFVLFLRNTRPRLARVALIVGTVILLGSSCRPISSLLILPLENTYPPMPRDLRKAVGDGLGIRYVVVLGGGSRNMGGVSDNNNLSSASNER